jgi:DNA-binding NarL/FixJ family response regulator
MHQTPSAISRNRTEHCPDARQERTGQTWGPLAAGGDRYRGQGWPARAARPVVSPGSEQQLARATLGGRTTSPDPWAAHASAVKHLLVLDDHRTFAEALACRLDAEQGISAFSVTTTGQARLALAERSVDIVLLDVDLDGVDGIQFAGKVRLANRDVRVIVVTACADESRVTDAIHAGICGWVQKDEPVEHLLTVIYGSLRVETWIPPRLLTGVLAELKSAHNDRAEHELLLATLTRREKEILCCLVSGMTRDAIADRLYLSRNTVRTHIQNLLGKLDVHSTLAAVALARRAGLTRSSAQPG